MNCKGILAATLVGLLVAVPVAAQEGDAAADTTGAAEDDQTVEADAREAGGEGDAAVPAHDWEFALAPSGNAPEAGGVVMVVEEEDGSSFRVSVEGLPEVDSLDSENRDVNAYTVWVVPSRDRVSESTLAGVIDVGPEGSGEFEGTTDLATFGVVVTATPDGAPERIGGVPVLTGIPVTSEPAEAATAEPPAQEGEAQDEPDAAAGDETGSEEARAPGS